MENWYALFLPGGTPKAIAVKLQEEISRVLLAPDTRKVLLGQGLDAVGNSQDEFARLYVAEIAKWAKVVKTTGVRLN